MACSQGYIGREKSNKGRLQLSLTSKSAPLFLRSSAARGVASRTPGGLQSVGAVWRGSPGLERLHGVEEMYEACATRPSSA